MTDEFSNPRDPSDDGPQSQEIRHTHVGALVPAHVARGVFSTGAVVLQGQHEFIIDFLLRMQKPQQLVARVVLPPVVVQQFIQALQENIRKREDRFGPIPSIAVQQNPENEPHPSELGGQFGDGTGTDGNAAAAGSAGPAGKQGGVEDIPKEPGSPPPQRNTAEELYEQLKLPEEILSGTYANAVMIGHTGTEFSFDFITTFFPRSSVAQRVFLSAPNVPRLLDSLMHSFQQAQNRRNTPPNAPPPPPVSPDDNDPDFS